MGEGDGVVRKGVRGDGGSDDRGRVRRGRRRGKGGEIAIGELESRILQAAGFLNAEFFS